MSSNHTEISRLHTSYSHTQQVLIEMADLLGHKWHPVILQQLVATEECGFSDLHAAIDDISNKMLSDSLTTLEEHGLVERVVVSEKPVRVRYSLTDRGRELEPALDAMVEWGRDHLSTAEPTPPSPPTATQATESADASPTIHWGQGDE
jgi:DNA-binding HxlR family transcriptional regulator